MNSSVAKKKRSGFKWRILAHRKNGTDLDIHNDGRFDELCLDDWFHIEEMNIDEWWMQIGDAYIYVIVSKKKDTLPKVFIDRGYYCHCKEKLCKHRRAKIGDCV